MSIKFQAEVQLEELEGILSNSGYVVFNENDEQQVVEWLSSAGYEFIYQDEQELVDDLQMDGWYVSKDLSELKEAFEDDGWTLLEYGAGVNEKLEGESALDVVEWLRYEGELSTALSEAELSEVADALMSFDGDDVETALEERGMIPTHNITEVSTDLLLDEVRRRMAFEAQAERSHNQLIDASLRADTLAEEVESLKQAPERMWEAVSGGVRGVFTRYCATKEAAEFQLANWRDEYPENMHSAKEVVLYSIEGSTHE